MDKFMPLGAVMFFFACLPIKNRDRRQRTKKRPRQKITLFCPKQPLASTVQSGELLYVLSGLRSIEAGKRLSMVLPFAQTIIVCRAASFAGVSPQAKFVPDA